MTLETFAKGIYLKNDTADAAASVDFDLLKQAGIRFVVPRMGDGDALYGASGFGHLNPGAFVDAGFAANVQAAYDYGMVCIPCWTLRIGPDYPQATGSPFQDDNQLVPFLYALKGKKPGVSYQALMVEIARDANGEIPDTDSNMAEYLDRFVSWIRTWLTANYPDDAEKLPIYVALDKETWEYGGQSVTNLIAQSGQEWPYMLLGQSEVKYATSWDALPEPSEELPVWEPGNLSGYKSKKGVIWEYARVVGLPGIKVSAWLLLFWNTPAGMVEKLGYTPRNWSDADPGSGNGGLDTGGTGNTDLSALVEAMDTLTAQMETQTGLMENILAKLKLPWWLRGKN